MPQGRNSNEEVRYFRGDTSALRDQLSLAPNESDSVGPYIISLPMPDGSLSRFSVVESSIMEPGLEAEYSDIKTYKLRGIDDPAASGRATITSAGFDAMLQTSAGRIFIDPEAAGRYKVFNYRAIATQGFSCGVHQGSNVLPDLSQMQTAQASRIPGSYQTYRLAVSATNEFVAATGGTVPAAQARIVTTINRVNQVYEQDLGIRLILIAGNDELIEEEDTGCLSNNDGFALLSENPVWIDHIIGNASYDIGHVFTTDNGGVAFIGSVCDSNFKASGTSGRVNPAGDPFYIDIVAHEIGHQFGADHTFNGGSGACTVGNRNASTAFEPGSGSSIMSYSGICGAENLQLNSDAMFHAGSITQINTFTTGGGSCSGTLANGNTDPTLTATADLIIPGDTPFRLDNASAIDADVGDTLSYQWDQMDAGTQTSSTTFGRDLGNNPLFRSYSPQPVSSRDFPALGSQLQGLYDAAETFACSDRDLNFRLTVRDNASGQVTDDVTVTVDRDAGPFRITSYNTTQTITSGAGPITLTWDVANTNAAPINCATVDIDLLTFDDVNYSNHSEHPILAATANDGTQDVTIIPITDSHPRARLRVKCTNSGFYDISDADLVIDGTDPTPIPFSDTDIATFFNSQGSTLTAVPFNCGVPRGVAVPVPAASATTAAPSVSRPLALSKLGAMECVLPRPEPGNGDASSADLRWLVLLALLAVSVNLLRSRLKLRADSGF